MLNINLNTGFTLTIPGNNHVKNYSTIQPAFFKKDDNSNINTIDTFIVVDTSNYYTHLHATKNNRLQKITLKKNVFNEF